MNWGDLFLKFFHSIYRVFIMNLFHVVWVNHSRERYVSVKDSRPHQSSSPPLCVVICFDLALNSNPPCSHKCSNGSGSSLCGGLLLSPRQCGNKRAALLGQRRPPNPTLTEEEKRTKSQTKRFLVLPPEQEPHLLQTQWLWKTRNGGNLIVKWSY